MDRSISDILGSATHVVLYNFDQSSSSWEKSNVEGSLCLAVRPSGYLLVILNRNSPDNYPIELTRDFQLQNNDPYLIIKNYDQATGVGKIRGVWFPNPNERIQMNDQLTEVLQVLKNGTPRAPAPAPPAAAAVTVDTASATAALLASLNVGVSSSSSSDAIPPRSNSNTSIRQMSPSSSSSQQQPTLDKKSLQLALLSLIQDDRFLDLLHAQYLKVHHARTSRNN
jgi:mRNA-decapping enzyme 1B